MITKNLFMSLFMTLLPACSHYKLVKANEYWREVLVAPNFITATCEDVEDQEIKKTPGGRFGFTIYFINERKLADPVIQGNVLDEEDCLKRKKAVEAMQRRGLAIQLRIHGSEDDSKASEREMTFAHGRRFRVSTGVYQLHAFWNEAGDCFDSQFEDSKPCPYDR
jgi:hypothetical protein